MNRIPTTADTGEKFLKFKVGEEVAIPHEGRTGVILLIDVYEKRYLIDPCPGAFSPYHWMMIPDGKGGGRCEAVCWVSEELLVSLKQPRKRGRS